MISLSSFDTRFANFFKKNTHRQQEYLYLIIYIVLYSFPSQLEYAKKGNIFYILRLTPLFWEFN